MCDLPPKAGLILKNRLTRANPAHHNAERLGFSPRGIPKKLYMYTLDAEGNIRIYRAMISEVERLCQEFNIDPTITDYRVTKTIPTFPVFNGRLEKYQAEALKSVKSFQGLFDIATAGGKTVLALALFAMMKQRTLVLVHTKDLKKQWIDRAKQFLPGVSIEGWDNVKKKEGAHITVSTYQSLSEMVGYFPHNYGLVLVDEAHHTASPTYRTLINSLPAKYRFGVTATVSRKDNTHFLVKSMFGDTIVKYGYEEISDRIVFPDVFVHHIPNSIKEEDLTKALREDTDEETGFDFTEMDKLLSLDALRNDFIASIVEQLYKRGRRVLLLVKRTAHADVLAEWLRRINVPAEALHSKRAKQDRERILVKAKEYQGVIVGTSIADEGLDIPCLDALVLGVPTFFDGRLVQRVGRVIRNSPGKKSAEVHDLVDTNIPIIFNSFLKRNLFYKRNKFEVTLDPAISAVINAPGVAITMV